MKHKSLTAEQQQLVIENHNLIYDFAKRKNLIIEEYYDILAIGLCNAALCFNPDRGKFSTIANHCMENILINHWKANRASSRIPEDLILSYDANKNGEESEDGDSFIDDMTDGVSVQNKVISDIACDSLMNLLNDKEKRVVRYIIQGLTVREIASLMNCKHPYISQIKSNIKKKWKAYENC